MRPLRGLIGIEKARQLLLARARPVTGTEVVRILDALGRVLARDVVAPHPVPPFARSAMDGYAVVAAATVRATSLAPRTFKLLGTVHAGGSFQGRVTRDGVVEIATGAPVPAGADAVVMMEDTEQEGSTVRVHKPAFEGQHVAPAGEDIEKGSTVAAAGTLLNPGRLGAIAAIGLPKVEVYRRPRVAVVPTGNEVRNPGEPLGPGQIHDVNSTTIATVALQHGAEPVLQAVVPDDPAQIEAAMRTAATNDILVITGGSSVGTRDHMADVLRRLGEVDFHGILVKPGKPTLGGGVGACLVLGMPGNPTSCLTNAYGLLIAVVRKEARLPPLARPTIRVPLARRVRSVIGLHQFMPVKLVKGQAVPLFKSSGAITSMAEADGQIEIPESVDLLEAGDEVEVALF